jgi:hypothetical protein
VDASVLNYIARTNYYFNMTDINIIDNVFTEDDVKQLHNLFMTKPFYYGETDNDDTPPTGLVHEITDSSLVNYFALNIHKYFNHLEPGKIYRSYVNLFIPRELPYFHIDGKNTLTCIIYINPNYDINEGGETQFLLDNKIVGIQPKSGRAVVFDGSILHRATSFRNFPRLTVALKYNT